jgi:hypothetical protein
LAKLRKIHVKRHKTGSSRFFFQLIMHFFLFFV